MKNITKYEMSIEDAVKTILSTKFNVSRPSYVTVFSKILKILKDQNITLYDFLVTEQNSMGNNFAHYYGGQIFESLVGDVVVAAYTLKELDCFSVIKAFENEFYSLANNIENNNYNVLKKYDLSFLFSDFDSDFRGWILDVLTIGGEDSSMPSYKIIKTKKLGEIYYYLFNPSQNQFRVETECFNTYQSILCFTLSKTYYDAIYKLVN